MSEPEERGAPTAFGQLDVVCTDCGYAFEVDIDTGLAGYQKRAAFCTDCGSASELTISVEDA